MATGTPLSLWRCCLAAGALLWPWALAQPICSVVGNELRAEAASRSKCGVGSYDELLPGGRRLSEEGLVSSWAPASIYRAAASQAGFGASAADPVLGSLDAHNPVVSISGEKLLRAAHFKPVVPASSGRWAKTWANTPEGEWLAEAIGAPSLSGARFMAHMPGSLRVNLEDTEGNCSLAGVSIYKTAPRTVMARLNFHGCSHVSGVTRAAVVVPVHPSVYGTSRLVDWMCAVMPHTVCPWDAQERNIPTLAPGVVALKMAATYLPMKGKGKCLQVGGRQFTHTRATTVGECAQECLSENTFATRHQGGTNCTGFAFSAQASEEEHCLIYMDTMVQAAGGVAASPWQCYYMMKATGESRHTGVAGMSREQRVAQAQQTIGLSLKTDVAFQGMGVRRRLTPVTSGCYEPFDWIDLSHASKHPHNARFGLPVTLNNSMFQMLVENLPVVDGSDARTAGDDSTAIGTDSVCVDAGSGLCRQSAFDPWPYLIPALFCAVGLIVGWCLGRRHKEPDTSAYVEISITDANGRKVLPTDPHWNALASAQFRMR